MAPGAKLASKGDSAYYGALILVVKLGLRGGRVWMHEL